MIDNRSMTLQDPCLCGSGKPLGDCCLMVASTTPPGARTGFSHPKCYARCLGDCSKTISSEHFASKSLLELLPRQVLLQAPFLPPEGKLLPASSVASNVLCTRHNSALSPLDKVAKRLFEFLLGRTNDEVIAISGFDFERWMLKVMSGLAATGHATSSRGARVTNREPQVPALELLFGEGTLPTGAGLYVPVRPGRGLPDAMGLTVMAENGHAAGLLLRFQFVELVFALAPLPPTLEDGTRLHYRPESVGLTIGGLYREVHLGWPHGGYLALTNPGPRCA